MPIGFALQGVKETIQILEKIKKVKSKAIQGAVKEATFMLEEDIVESVRGNRSEVASVKTGRFLGSIQSRFPEKNSGLVVTNVEYAPHLEYGTTNGLKARRHFRNSVLRMNPKIRKLIGKSAMIK